MVPLVFIGGCEIPVKHNIALNQVTINNTAVLLLDDSKAESKLIELREQIAQTTDVIAIGVLGDEKGKVRYNGDETDEKVEIVAHPLWINPTIGD